jgi:hypothetical protein
MNENKSKKHQEGKRNQKSLHMNPRVHTPAGLGTLGMKLLAVYI